MKNIDPIVEDVIKDKMPEATIVKAEAPARNARPGVRKSAKAEAMIAKWSAPSFLRSHAAAADSVPTRAQHHDIDVAVVEVTAKGGSGRKLRQTVVVDKTSKEIIAISG
ncbi:hypothetical protein ABFU18_20145 [Xanthomonas campestris pv. campestris]|uniref:hypothetical protein n=1 Tax=Xanthomonas campestris TaxID=339 RepID=UPI001C85F6EE|nr:hypothetical protein [Xanthomonas campestris]MDM7693307.1 hypothetical protein [Xanthomonas campestris pv. campestris]MDM7840529.1 hypothetical protein [Xanthomonas campestris pv. campestris]MDM7876575.1 hypothetical protein [Xanthomonas campestris pv. campestris]